MAMRFDNIVSRLMSGPWPAMPLLMVVSWVFFLLLAYGAYIVGSEVVEAVRLIVGA